MITTQAFSNSNKVQDKVSSLVSASWHKFLRIRNQFGNHKSIWKSEINLEIGNQRLEIRNYSELKPRKQFSKVYPSNHIIVELINIGPDCFGLAVDCTEKARFGLAVGCKGKAHFGFSIGCSGN